MGIDEALVKKVLAESLKDHIKHTSSFVQKHAGSDFIKEVEKDLKGLQELDYSTWMRQLDAYIISKRSIEEDGGWSYDEGPLKLLSDYDQRIILRAILEHIDEKEIVTLDLTGLVSDWLDEQGSDSRLREDWELISGIPIIITEGTYDAQVLKGAIEVLKPHIAPYIRFLDYSFKNEGGASVAVNTLKSFAAAGISNRIVAIFDNDSAAYEAVSILKDIKLPSQYKVIHYPDIELANEYPTLGPQGDVAMMSINWLGRLNFIWELMYSKMVRVT